MKRSEKQHIEKTKKSFVFILGLLVAVLAAALLVLALEQAGSRSWKNQLFQSKKEEQTGQEVRIMANGDLLYHDLIYMSYRKEDGSYDFDETLERVKPWLSQADLVIGDFEGTISPDYPLAGYPLFNAPAETATSIKKAGYQVLDLAHNHILDSGLSGISSTVSTFDRLGIDTVGVFAKQDRDNAPILVKEVKGIRIAILAYSYGYNELEANLTKEEYNARLADLDEDKIKADLKRAEAAADVTIVMPQMGVEYALEPTEEQVALYHKMIDWGADIVFGGHPHVVEPAEVLEKDNQKKLIIYSMGNFLSNQRLETMDNLWTERGVLMDVTIKKEKNEVQIKDAKARPSWVRRWEKGYTTDEGYPAYHYQTYILEDLIQNGRYRDGLTDEEKERVDQAYQEMIDHVGLSWPSSQFPKSAQVTETEALVESGE